MTENKDVLDHWNNPAVQSMYDKNLIGLEINLIKSKLRSGVRILDAGCGEGEGTLAYSKVDDVIVYGADYSDTRLEKATLNLCDQKNVILLKIDFLDNFSFDCKFDFIVSQRFLINLMDWDLQKKVIRQLSDLLNQGGRMLLLEGSIIGVNELNEFRSLFGLSPIPVQWHNLFFNDKLLENFFEEEGLTLIEKEGLGEYFMLTRGIRPFFDKDLTWENKFNEISTNTRLVELLNLKERLSRLKLWVVEKR